MRALGVGLVYWTELAPLFAPGTAALPVLELEPQSIWEKVHGPDGPRYQVNQALLDAVARLPQAKLLHGVGHPVGGTVADPVEHLSLLREAADQLDAAWVSEHLSFNRVDQGGGVEHAGFLLPPRQSAAGARVAARNMQALGQAMGRPVAFETGVNYFAPRADELADGSYFAQVARQADCGILLDLHNLWCNERNGRQSVADALALLPLDRVWELHLAGGMPHQGLWLDAHTGAVPAEVMDIAASLMPRLPNLGAMIFEILPEHVPRIGLDGVRTQLDALQGLWGLRPAGQLRVCEAQAALPGAHHTPPLATDLAEVAAWELAVVAAIRMPSQCDGPFLDLVADPGTRVLRELIDDFRRASLARTLHYSLTTLLLALGRQGTHELMDAYMAQVAPEPFAAVEADQFASFLREHLPQLRQVPHLAEVLAFEHALVRVSVHARSSEISWSVDPTRLLDGLDAGQLPTALPQVPSRMQILAA
jgi:uncharacterized protein (UPF0276 family)